MWERRGFQVGDVVPGPDGQAVHVVRVIAEGGFSVVYEGRMEPSGTPCAIKALRLKHAGNRKTVERLLREGRALYALRHPNVVPVTHIGMRTEDELIYLVMKLLKGRNLRELQQDLTASQRDAEGDKRPRPHARLPVSWVLEIAMAMCSALDAIHNQASAVHRDMKPENTFVEDDGNVSLFDVGSAKFPNETRLTTNDVTIGTVQYMSPEQLFRPADVDHRSDLFALGIILYELFSGVLPFAAAPGESNDAQAQGTRIIFRPHRPLKASAPHLPDYIIEIVERLLRKLADERYPSAARVRDLLAAAHARFVAGLGDLAPLPLADAVAAVPRTTPDATVEPAPLPPLPTSTNPFITISLPPELPQEAATKGAPVVAPGVTTEELPASAIVVMPLAAEPAGSVLPHATVGTAGPQPEARAAPPPSKAAYVFVPPPTSTDVSAAASQHDPASSAVQDTPQAGVAPALLDGEANRRAAALRRYIAELPEDLRQAFVLNQIHEMPIDEIAERIGIPAAAVRERVLAARATLGARMDEETDAARAAEAPQTAQTPAPAVNPQRDAGSLSSHVREVPPPAAPGRHPAVRSRRAPTAKCACQPPINTELRTVA
jgi:serine/threonine-protein kinase